MTKKILITGIAGFVGSHLCEYVLNNTDYDIIGLDNLNYSGNLNRVTSIDGWEKYKKRVKFVYHDLQAPITELTHNIIGKVDYVIHLAAESVVKRSLQDPLLFIKSNTIGTANVMEYVRQLQPCVESVIYFSSDEVLGPADDDEGFLENQPLNPSSPYSASKACGELISKSWATSYNLPIVTVRSSNIYGTKQYPEDFIPKIMRDILENKKIELHGSLERPSSRIWVDVKDVSKILLFLLEHGCYGEIYHIEGEKKDVYWIAKKVFKIINKKDLESNDIRWIKNPYVGHDFAYGLKDSKLKKMKFGLEFNLEKGLEEIIKFTIKNTTWLNIPKKVKI